MAAIKNVKEKEIKHKETKRHKFFEAKRHKFFLLHEHQPKMKIRLQGMGKTALTERWIVAWGKPGRRAAGATPGKINNSFAPWQGRWICRQIRRPFRARFFGGFTRGCAYRSAVKLAPG